MAYKVNVNGVDKYLFGHFEEKEKTIEELREAERKAAEEAYHQEKLNEAQQIIDDANNAHPYSNMNPDWFMLEIIAKLLERIDDLEKKIPSRDCRNETFSI